MKFLKILLIVIVSLIALFFLVGMFLPKTYNVERSTVINASDSTVYANISDFNEFQKWNPWLKKDPGAKVNVSGLPQTIGHLYQWNGKETGKGQMKVIGLTPNQMVDIELMFIEPMASTCNTKFKIEKADGGQKVTWSMAGENHSTMEKWFGLAMDGMIGKDFEDGLKFLKEKSEVK